MVDLIRRFFRLSHDERRLVLRARWQLTLVAAALRFGGLARASHIVERLNARVKDESADERAEQIRRTAALVAAAARLGPSGTCLSRSLVLRGLLGRHGIDSTLRLGIRRGERFEGHAWVEVDGHPLNDTPDVAARYVPLAAESIGSLRFR